MIVFVAWPSIDLVRFSFSSYDGLTAASWVGLGDYWFLWNWHDFRRILFNNPCGRWFRRAGCRPVHARRARLSNGASPTWSGRSCSSRRCSRPSSSARRSASCSPTMDRSTSRSPSGTRDVGAGLAFQSAVRVGHRDRCHLLGDDGQRRPVLLLRTGASLSPSDVEAAALDGANFRQIVWQIDCPALRPITRFWMIPPDRQHDHRILSVDLRVTKCGPEFRQQLWTMRSTSPSTKEISLAAARAIGHRRGPRPLGPRRTTSRPIRQPTREWA